MDTVSLKHNIRIKSNKNNSGKYLVKKGKTSLCFHKAFCKEVSVLETPSLC